MRSGCNADWRSLKNAIEAKLTVLDGLYTSLHSYGETPGVTGSTFNLHGANARVNFNSHDSSVNVAVTAPEEVLTELRRLVQTHVTDPTRQAQVLDVVQEMEETKGTPRFFDTYSRFTAFVADHIQVYGPLIPLLVQWGQAALS